MSVKSKARLAKDTVVWLFRSAITGRFVKESTARRHPRETTRERRR